MWRRAYEAQSLARVESSLSRLRDEQRGAALMGTVLAVLIFSTVGMVSVNVALQETGNVNVARDQAAAQQLTEAGVDLITQWFHDPSAAPPGVAGTMLMKRLDPGGTGASFFDAQGKSQFTGTPDRPDILLDASRRADDRLLHDPATGWFRSLSGIGKIRKLKVYGPSRPGLLCTVEVTVAAGSITRTRSFQLAANSIPPLRPAVQVGVTVPNRLSDASLPVSVHWGELLVKGDATLTARREIPLKTSIASLSGRSYADMTTREDRWFEIKVGGEAVFLDSSDDRVAALPPNVHLHQDPLPGLNLDRWDYEMLKKQALMYGTYYAMDRQGLLYKNGKMEPGLGLTAERLFGAEHGETPSGLIFIDTLDQRSPGLENLGTLAIEPTYLDGVFVINAHLHVKPKGSGRSVAAFSPPAGDPSAGGGMRQAVQLSGIHVKGVLHVADDLVVAGRTGVYGALVTGGTVAAAPGTSDSLEIWYDYDLHHGLIRGVPLVSLAPGTVQDLS